MKLLHAVLLIIISLAYPVAGFGNMKAGEACFVYCFHWAKTNNGVTVDIKKEAHTVAVKKDGDGWIMYDYQLGTIPIGDIDQVSLAKAYKDLCRANGRTSQKAPLSKIRSLDKAQELLDELNIPYVRTKDVIVWAPEPDLWAAYDGANGTVRFSTKTKLTISEAAAVGTSFWSKS